MNTKVKVSNGRLVQLNSPDRVETNMDFPLNGDESYRNLFGSYKKYDAEQTTIDYNLYVKTYPDSTDCTVLNNEIAQIQNQIDQFTAIMAGSCDAGCKRTHQRAINAYNKRKTDLQNQLIKNSCSAVQTAQSNAAFQSQLNNVLGQASATTPATTTGFLGSLMSGINSLTGEGTSNSTGNTPIPQVTTNPATGQQTVTYIDPATGQQVPAPAAKKTNWLLYGGIGVGAILLIVIIKKIV